jgi:hypothetical protein
MKLPSQQAADSAAAAKHEPADLSAPAENSEADAPVDDAWSMIAEKSSEAAENPVHPQKHAL